MNSYNFLGVLLLSLSSCMSLIAIVTILLKGRKTAVVYSYVACQLMIFIWSFFEMFYITSSNRSTAWIFTCLYFLAVCFIGVAWLMFCLCFTKSRIIYHKKILIPIFIPPILFYIALLTNEKHKLFFSYFEYHQPKDFAILFWLHTAVSYIYLLLGVIILLIDIFKKFGSNKMQSILMLIAMVIPFMANLLLIMDVIKYPGFDITSVCFSISLLIFAVVIFRYRFLDLLPIALDRILNIMKEGIVIIDDENRVIEYNPSFMRMFPGNEIKKNSSMGDFTGYLRKCLQANDNNINVLNTLENGCSLNLPVEIRIKIPENKVLSIYIQEVVEECKNTGGRIVIFNDITEYKNMLDELEDKNYNLINLNKELVHLNEQLETHAKTVEELAVSRERNRFAIEMHDTLGKTMTLLTSIFELSIGDFGEFSEKYKSRLFEGLKLSKQTLNELRSSILEMTLNNNGLDDFLNSINKLFLQYKLLGVEIDFTYKGEYFGSNRKYFDALYRVCQEALTNSVRHGKAKNISIILQFFSDRIRLSIFDDGIGCKVIKKGFGLSNMEEKVKLLKGKLIVGSDGKKGFNINIDIPIGGR